MLNETEKSSQKMFGILKVEILCKNTIILDQKSFKKTNKNV